MPRIQAGTVREHRELMLTTLVDAAEQIVITEGVDALTAGRVTAAAGIARNSLYRHVASMDELRLLVIDRHLPAWTDAVLAAMQRARSPRGKVLAYVEENLNQAAETGHGWLISMSRGLSESARADVVDAHRVLGTVLVEQIRQLDPSQAALSTALVQAVLEAGFTRRDEGDPHEVVLERCRRAVKSILGGVGH